MTGPIVLGEDMINRIAKDVERRIGVPVIGVKEALERASPEEFIIRGIIATIKGGESDVNFLITE